MGYADGYYYGQGRIICDTSTFSVGDTIRVRSMTDSSKIWDKQVATVGTALVFTVPPYDYYKICTVQTIDNTPTEIGGVYRTVDYGQTLFIDVLDKKTLVGMQGILNSHKELDTYNIGDEITITINDGTIKDWIMQVGRIDGTNHTIDLVSKEVYKNSQTYYQYTSSALRTNAQAFYNSIVNNDKGFIKQVTRKCRENNAIITYSDYVWVLGVQEVSGNDVSCEQSQLPIFTTQSNRIKTYNGTATNWWTADAWSPNSPYYINNSGAYSTANQTSEFGLVPCFRLTADS